jgi:lysophospholipase L1-like esterase
VEATATVGDPALFFSPYNWRRAGGAYAESNNPGAYLKTVFTGTYARLGVDVSALAAAGVAAGAYPTLRYSIDDGPWTDRQLAVGDTSILLQGGLAGGSHTLLLYFNAAGSGVDRWTTPLSAVRVTGLVANGAFAAPATRSQRLLVFWDSIGEGAALGGATGTTMVSDATQSSIPAMAVGLEAEVGAVCFSGQGYARAGGGGVPMLYNTASPAASAWDRHSGGQSRLVNGLLSPAPDYVVCALGTNDGLAGIADATVTATVAAWLAAARGAAPSARLCVVVPLGRYKAAAIGAGVAAYQTATPDALCHLIDLGAELGAGLTAATPGGTRTSADGTHPRGVHNGAVAAELVRQIRGLRVRAAALSVME